MNRVGYSFLYYTWDDHKSFDGVYYVGEGGLWGWHIVKGFKTVGDAKRWAIKRAGTDTYTE